MRLDLNLGSVMAVKNTPSPIFFRFILSFIDLNSILPPKRLLSSTFILSRFRAGKHLLGEMFFPGRKAKSPGLLQNQQLLNPRAAPFVRVGSNNRKSSFFTSKSTRSAGFGFPRPAAAFHPFHISSITNKFIIAYTASFFHGLARTKTK